MTRKCGSAAPRARRGARQIVADAISRSQQQERSTMKWMQACTAACLIWAGNIGIAGAQQAPSPSLLALPDVYVPPDSTSPFGPRSAGYFAAQRGAMDASVSAVPSVYDDWATTPASYQPLQPLPDSSLEQRPERLPEPKPEPVPSQPLAPRPVAPRPVTSMSHLRSADLADARDWLQYQQGPPTDETQPETCGDDAAACGPCAPCPPVCCRPMWYGGLFGLFMGRDRGNRFWTSAQSNNNFNQVLNTQDADTSFRGGGEVTFGRWFGCDCACGLQATYWTLDPWRGFASLSEAQTGFFFNTPIDLQLVTIGGVPATNYFDGASEHFISRRDELHNVELNLWKPLFFGPGQVFEMGCLAGVRYLRFNEDLLFGSVAGGGIFGGNGGMDEAYLDTNVINNLVGFQIGSRANLWITPRWSIYCQPLVGVMGNHLSHEMRLYRGDGVVGFDLQSTANDVSFLGQLDLGVQWRIGHYCSAYAGYRVLGISGIALADEQIPPFLIDSPVILDIDSNADLIVHGGVFGLMWNY